MADQKKVLIHVDDVKMHFPIKKKSIINKQEVSVKAVDGISLDIYEGETLGLVGESGCGKSTLGRVILQLYKQTAGNIVYEDKEYMVLLPLDDEDAGLVILEIQPVDEETENYVSVENPDTLNAVYGIFKERYKDVLEFED